MSVHEIASSCTKQSKAAKIETTNVHTHQSTQNSHQERRDSCIITNVIFSYLRSSCKGQTQLHPKTNNYDSRDSGRWYVFEILPTGERKAKDTTPSISWSKSTIYLGKDRVTVDARKKKKKKKRKYSKVNILGNPIRHSEASKALSSADVPSERN